MKPLALFGLFPNIQPGRYGGIEHAGRLAWQALTKTVQARGEDTGLFCYEWDGSAEDNPGDRIIARTKTQAIWRILRYPNKPRVILVWHLALLKLVPLLRAPQARVVVFLHGIEAWRGQDGLTRRILPRVNLFLSNSEFTHRRFLEYVPRAGDIPYRVTALGLGEPDVSTETPSDVPALLVLGRMARGEDYKGHRDLIGAWSRVRALVPGAQLWIAGEGDLSAELKMLAGDDNAIRFLGRVSDAQKSTLLGASRALGMPSRGEGFGMVYLEAMRIGRPCLVSDCDAGREVVNPPEAGLAVDPSNKEALADAVARLLTGGAEWTQWSLRARARYEANFTAAHFRKRLVEAMDPL